jgi:hypothetical protein
MISAVNPTNPHQTFNNVTTPPEHPSFLRFEQENRKERDDDNQEREVAAGPTCLAASRRIRRLSRKEMLFCSSLLPAFVCCASDKTQAWCWSQGIFLHEHLAQLNVAARRERL